MFVFISAFVRSCSALVWLGGLGWAAVSGGGDGVRALMLIDSLLSGGACT